MKRKISVLLIIVLVILQFIPGYPLTVANAQGTESAVLYSGESVVFKAAAAPVEVMGESADLLQGKYLKIILFLDGELADSQVFRYEQNPGITETIVQEGFGLDSFKLDGEKFTSGSEIIFSEEQENQVITLEISLYTRAQLIVHYQDEEGNLIAEDERIEGKLNEEVQLPVKNVDGYSLQSRFLETVLTKVKDETVLVYQQIKQNSFSDENMQPAVDNKLWTRNGTSELKIQLENAEKINIEADSIKFNIQSDPVPNGKIVVKIPAFFSLKAVPSNTPQYSVSVEEEIITSDNNDVLCGIEQTVLSLSLYEVSSTVKVSFEMFISDEMGLTEAMVRAKEHPESVPLNLVAELYNKENQLLSSTIEEGTSALSNPSELTESSWEELTVSRYKLDPSNLQYNAIKPQFNKEPVWSLNKYHYPYTEIALLIPVTENLLDVYTGGSYYGLDEAEQIEYGGQKYWQLLSNSVPRSYADSYGFSALISELRFSNDVKVGTTTSFNAPVLFRYTYKGEIQYQELYNLPEYTWRGPWSPQADKKEESGWAGEEVALSNIIRNLPNANSKFIPQKWENLIMELTYPYELQPKEITSLGKSGNYKISYIVADKDEAQREVTDTIKSFPYVFDLQENEYVKKISITIPELEVKQNFSYGIKVEAQTYYEDGTLIQGGDRVDFQTKVMGNESLETLSEVNQQFIFKTLRDAMMASTDAERPSDAYKILLTGSEDAIELPGLEIFSQSEDCKSYKNSKLILEAPNEIKTKLIGYKFEVNNSEFPGVKIIYDTNKESRKEILTNKLSSGESEIYNFELSEGEYIINVQIELGDLTKEELYKESGYACKLTPIINLKRGYYDDSGEELPPEYNKIYAFSYTFSTDSPPAQYMTKNEMRAYVSYCSYVEYQLTMGDRTGDVTRYALYNQNDELTSAGYRGQNLKVTLSSLSYLHEPNIRNPIELDSSLFGDKCKFYIELDSDFEIMNLSTSGSSIMEPKILENGNILYGFEIECGEELTIRRMEMTLWIRPDADVEETHEPIKAIGLCWDDYFEEKFPDYPECTDAKENNPYQIVTCEKEELPSEWGIDDGKNQCNIYVSFSSNSKNFQIREVTTSTTVMYGMLDSMLREEKVEFYEAQREKLGLKAFIAPSESTTVYNYKTTFELPRKGKDITGNNGTSYSAQYSIFLSDMLKIYKDRQLVDLTEAGIEIVYLLEDETRVSSGELKKEQYQNVKKVEVSFAQISDGTVYELQMPLCTEPKNGADTENWTSYIGNTNQTGDNTPVYLSPFTYVYKSYEIQSTFGLDRNENGNWAWALGMWHKLSVYNENWEELFSISIDATNNNPYISEKFNTGGEKLTYIGFQLDSEETGNYLPTQRRIISDLLSNSSDEEAYIHEFGDGTKIWYLPIDEEDFIADSTDGKYDALFIRKPEITAEDITLAVDETGELEFSVSQPVNEDIVKDYEISVRLLEENDDQKDIAEIQKNNTNDNYEATGLKKGTVPYEVIVKNTQGMSFIAKANIIVGNKLYTPLPHVGGTGAGNFAFTGFILIAGGGAVAITRKRKKLPL